MYRSKKFIMGRNSIHEVLKSHPERIIKVYTSQTKGLDSLYLSLKKKGIKIVQAPKQTLSQMVSSESHQSYVAQIKDTPLIHVKDFLHEAKNQDQSLVIMLDSIFDPQNLGSIIRSCECFKTDLVIYSKNRGCDITPVASKTSAGATELVAISKVSNLAETMQLFQKEGYFAICADVSERSTSLYEFSFPEKTLLIMGSEGEGIQPLLKKKCDFHISIPMLGQIDSLNVSQATAVFLNAYRNFFFNALSK